MVGTASRVLIREVFFIWRVLYREVPLYHASRGRQVQYTYMACEFDRFIPSSPLYGGYPWMC